MNLQEIAYTIALGAHASQERVGGEPYIKHPLRVAEAVAAHGDEYVQAALLHDVVEDSNVTLADLLEVGFTHAVVAAVDSVTRREGETYMDMIRRAAADPIGRVIKLADNLDNSNPESLALFDADRRAFAEKRYAKARLLLEHDTI